MKSRSCMFALLAFAALTLSSAVPAAAQQVWTGYDFSFEKPNFGDPTDPLNQDQITGAVALTRADNQGLFNIAQEGGYTDFVSPADTEWAFGNAADWESLTFDCWECITGSTPPDMVGQAAVVHLISDDIYIDIIFDSWTSGGQGGGFSYRRATGDPTPVEESTWGVVKALYRN